MIVPQVEWALNTRWDADFPDLEIGCQKIQNEGSSTIKVSHDGNTVWITPYNKDYTYIFNISEGTVTTGSSIQNAQYLYMKRDEGGWYADGLFKSDAPSEKWWSN